MKKKQPYNNNLSNLFLLACLIGLFISCATVQLCEDCGETNCIYQEINNNVQGEGSDQDIMNAIYKVCKQRGISDEKTIDLIKANYYL